MGRVRVRVRAKKAFQMVGPQLFHRKYHLSRVRCAPAVMGRSTSPPLLSDLVAFVPSVFGRNLQRDPVRKWTERNDIGPFYRLFTYNPGNTLARFKREQA